MCFAAKPIPPPLTLFSEAKDSVKHIMKKISSFIASQPPFIWIMGGVVGVLLLSGIIFSVCRLFSLRHVVPEPQPTSLTDEKKNI